MDHYKPGMSGESGFLGCFLRARRGGIIPVRNHPRCKCNSRSSGFTGALEGLWADPHPLSLAGKGMIP